MNLVEGSTEVQGLRSQRLRSDGLRWFAAEPAQRLRPTELVPSVSERAGVGPAPGGWGEAQRQWTDGAVLQLRWARRGENETARHTLPFLNLRGSLRLSPMSNPP